MHAASFAQSLERMSEARYTAPMVSLPLETALSVLTLASIMMCVQLIIMTVEIVALRRDLRVLMRTTSELNHAVNPWAGEDAITEPGLTMLPPRFKRRRWGWFLPVRRPKQKRQRPSE
jgi:hypothetical protein